MPHVVDILDEVVVLLPERHAEAGLKSVTNKSINQLDKSNRKLVNVSICPFVNYSGRRIYIYTSGDLPTP